MRAVREKSSKQLNEARRIVEAQGKTQPTQEELNTATQLRNEVVKKPLTDRDADKVQQARQTMEKQEDFNNALAQHLHEIRAKEGPSEAQCIWTAIEVSTGLTAEAVVLVSNV